MEISVGENVEVCSKEDGFLGSYFVAKVVAKVGKHLFKVEYATLVSEEDKNQKLREVVHESEVRPCPPVLRVSEFKVMESVDVYDREGWWVGRVTGRDDGDHKYSVYFDSTGDEFLYPGCLLRLHQEWEDGIWVPSQIKARRILHHLPLGQSTSSRHEISPSTSKMEISVGEYIEVCSKEDGFLGSYFVAKVLGKVGEHRFKVEYTTLVSEEDENQKLREVVNESEVRPCPPVISVSEFKVMESVDAYDREGWWVGRVTGRKNGDEDKYSVYFDSTGDEFVYPVYLLRLHQEWEDGIWVPSQRKGMLGFR